MSIINDIYRYKFLQSRLLGTQEWSFVKTTKSKDLEIEGNQRKSFLVYFWWIWRKSKFINRSIQLQLKDTMNFMEMSWEEFVESRAKELSIELLNNL